MKIKTKLILFSSLCSFIPLLLTFLVSFQTAKSSLNNAVVRSLHSNANQQLENIQRMLLSTESKLDAFKKITPISGIFDRQSSLSLQWDIHHFVAGIPNVIEMLVTDHSGAVVSGYFESNVRTDYSNTWEFESARLGIHLNSKYVRSHQPEGYIFMESMPIYPDNLPGEVVGTLIYKANLNYALEKMNSLWVYPSLATEHRRL